MINRLTRILGIAGLVLSSFGCIGKEPDKKDGFNFMALQNGANVTHNNKGLISTMNTGDYIQAVGKKPLDYNYFPVEDCIIYSVGAGVSMEAGPIGSIKCGGLTESMQIEAITDFRCLSQNYWCVGTALVPKQKAEKQE